MSPASGDRSYVKVVGWSRTTTFRQATLSVRDGSGLDFAEKAAEGVYLQSVDGQGYVKTHGDPAEQPASLEWVPGDHGRGQWVVSSPAVEGLIAVSGSVAGHCRHAPPPTGAWELAFANPVPLAAGEEAGPRKQAVPLQFQPPTAATRLRAWEKAFGLPLRAAADEDESPWYSTPAPAAPPPDPQRQASASPPPDVPPASPRPRSLRSSQSMWSPRRAVRSHPRFVGIQRPSTAPQSRGRGPKKLGRKKDRRPGSDASCRSSESPPAGARYPASVSIPCVSPEASGGTASPPAGGLPRRGAGMVHAGRPPPPPVKEQIVVGPDAVRGLAEYRAQLSAFYAGAKGDPRAPGNRPAYETSEGSDSSTTPPVKPGAGRLKYASMRRYPDARSKLPAPGTPATEHTLDYSFLALPTPLHAVFLAPKNGSSLTGAIERSNDDASSPPAPHPLSGCRCLRKFIRPPALKPNESVNSAAVGGLRGSDWLGAAAKRDAAGGASGAGASQGGGARGFFAVSRLRLMAKRGGRATRHRNNVRKAVQLFVDGLPLDEQLALAAAMKGAPDLPSVDRYACTRVILRGNAFQELSHLSVTLSCRLSCPADLTFLDLSDNRLACLPPMLFSSVPGLRSLFLHKNSFCTPASISSLSEAASLTTLTMHGCPFEVSDRKGYRFAVLCLVPSLRKLDHCVLTDADFEWR
eukprot:gene9215-14285_t